MQIRIKIFGQLTDIIHNTELTLSGMTDTDSVLNELNGRYPALANAKYIVAVDKQAISGNTILKEGSAVALLPPFSGG